MPVFLINLLRPLAPYLAAAVVLLGATVYVMTLRHHLQTAEQQNAMLAAQNAANAAAIASFQVQEQKNAAALSALDAQTLASTTATARISEKIQSAPPGDDGPVAPVLSHAMDDLRALQGDAP
jgi:hypothetical protein